MAPSFETEPRECSCHSGEIDREQVLKIIEQHGKEEAALIPVLDDIQALYTYLPSEALKLVAETTGRSLVDVYGVATFYHSFSLKPRGKHIITVCSGTACHLRGGPSVAKEFERQLGVCAGETTPDGEFTLEAVNCLGVCALGPMVMAGNRFFSHVDESKVSQIIERVREGLDKGDATSDN